MEFIGNLYLQIYVNTNRKSLAQIKAETGCKAIINGGLFDMSTFQPNCHLKVNGNVFVSDPYTYWGYGWNNGEQPILVNNYFNLDNYICCVCMVRNGQREQMYYNSAVGGSRPRTAIGLFPDGRIWMYANTTSKTPEQLQDLAISKGLKSAIMLDGGGSTQCIFPHGYIQSSRRVHNCILAFDELPSRPVCPYTEPNYYIQYGSSGEGAKWVQWHLNQHGYNLEVDGIFGNLSTNALRNFQSTHGLDVDGICGALTRAELKNY